MSSKTIGPKLKRFRKTRKLTQDQLAKSLGYSGKSVISHIEKGDADMTYEKILLLIKTYMLDANELFDVEELNKLIDEEQNRQKHDRVIVYIHGLHGNAKEANFYKFLSDYDVKGLDYEDGNPWEVGPIIKDKFQEMIKPYKEVVVVANSIGAFYAYEYLNEFNIKQAFFISPIASMFKIIFDYIFTGKISKEELKEKKLVTLEDGTTLSYDFYERYSESDYHGNWNVPTDILYGSNDELVYIENIMEFLKNHPLSKLTIKQDAGHWFHTDEELDFIKSWILRNIKGN